jgi:hypothetical protein
MDPQRELSLWTLTHKRKKRKSTRRKRETVKSTRRCWRKRRKEKMTEHCAAPATVSDFIGLKRQ